MDVPWTYKLQDGQRGNPAVYATKIKLPDSVAHITDDQLLKAWGKKDFAKTKRLLKTWGRSKGDDGRVKRENDPHWIANLSGTPLHMDPKYPRYSHHLKIRIDGDIIVRGIDEQELQLARGVFYILDTHSPHQVLVKNKDQKSWNVAVSIDSYEILEPKKAIEKCLLYAMTTDFLAGL